MHVDCTCLADLPTGESISDDKNRKFVTLPLVCLGMFKGGMRCAFLLVTDFTNQTNSTVFANLLPLPVPTDYEVGGQKLDRAQVFSISIGGPYIQRCWTELSKFTPNMQNYSYSSDALCDFSKEGVVALVNFRVQPHNTQKNSIEGFYSRMTICNREMLRRPESLPKYDERVFLNFMARYVQHMNIELYDNLVRSFPVERYVQRNVVLRNERDRQEEVRKEMERQREIERRGQMERERAQTERERGQRVEHHNLMKTDLITQAPPGKVRRLMGAQVMFQQHFTQTEQAESPESGSQDSEEFLDSTQANGNDSERRNDVRGTGNGNGVNRPGNGSGSNALEYENGVSAPGNGFSHRDDTDLPIGSGRQHPTEHTNERVLMQHTGSAQQSWSHYSINKVDFATLARVACHSLTVGTIFETNCQIHSVRPPPRQIFIRPFRRTLKIAPIVIYLTQGTDLVKVELHTEEEKCKFLGLEETEEAIGKIDELSTRLGRLPGARAKLRLEKRSMTLDFGYERSYWSTSTSLDRML